MSEAVLYTTIAAVHRHRQDLVVDSPIEPGTEVAAPIAVVEAIRYRRIQPPCVWQPISCGAWAQVHICAEDDGQTPEARLRIVVWIQESGAVVLNDTLGTGCRWWQNACDDRAFRRLTGVDGRTYGFQFRSETKATECSRIIDHVLANPGALDVVAKLMRANVDLQGLVMAWQDFSLHSIHCSSSPLRIHSDAASLPPPSTLLRLRADRRSVYPKEQEIVSLWRDEEQQDETFSRNVQTPPDEDSSTASSDKSKISTIRGPEDDSLLAGEEDNQADDLCDRMATSPVALLETGGEMDMETQLVSPKKPSPGEWISRPYNTRAEIHVTYDAEHARYEGLPDGWRTINRQFGLDLDQVPKREVEGYDSKLPAVLEMMKTCFMAHDGARTEGVFRLAPDQTEYNAVKAAIEEGSFEDCCDVHIMASLIKVWFRELPISLFNMLPEQQIALTCELVNTESKVVLESLATLPSLHQGVVLWLLDLLNEVVKYEHENKMTAKSMAIVMAPNLLSVNNLDTAIVATAYRQVADFVQMLMHARLQQRSTGPTRNIES